MNRQEFETYLSLCIQKVDFLKRSTSDGQFEDQANILTHVENYLNDISSDFQDNIVPGIFFDRLAHNFEELGFSMLNDGVVQGDVIIHPNRIKSILDRCCMIREFQNAYYIYKKLDFVKENIVLVGANGCGKSTLANTFVQTLNVQDGIVIPAQKLLLVPTFQNVPNYQTALSSFITYDKDVIDDKMTYSVQGADDFPYELSKKYSQEYRQVLSTLIAERFLIRNKFCDSFQNGGEVTKEMLNSNLDKVFDIWNELIGHRTLGISDNNNLEISFVDNASGEKKVYEAYKMSDGERIILYLVGRVVLAPKNSLIVVDEPEIYLHKTIVNKLWDKLENERCDCKFIYLTHDISFAVSRTARKCWIKSFDPDNHWIIEEVLDNEIPEEMLLELLGSRKKILFCEGRKNSMDVQIFNIIFPTYTIKPVGTCSDVINFTKAFNKIDNTYAKAYGIIDRDYRDQAQLDKLMSENVFSYDVAEIENVFLDDAFLTQYANYKKEVVDVSVIKERVIEHLSRNKAIQASCYVSARINHLFNESHMSVGNTEYEVSQNFSSFISNVNVHEWYTERVLELERIIDNSDYRQAIRVFNNKGLHRIVESVFGIVPGSFRTKALAFLQQSIEAQSVIRELFPSPL